MKHDFKAAWMWLDTEPNAPKHFTKHGNESARETIRFALRLAEIVTEEPSAAILEAATESVILGNDANGKSVHLSDKEAMTAFKAMRDVMLKEIEG